MHAHTGKVCSKAFFGLNKIRQIRKFILDDATKTLVHAFVTSHVDYCNSLLYGLSQYQLNRLQRALNAVARVTCHLSKYSHITPGCSNSTGFLLPRGSDLRSCCWFTKRLKAPLHLTQLSCDTSSLRVATHCVTTINTSSWSNELNGKVCH